MKVETYLITEKAGAYLAGKRLAKDQKTISLTEPEARYELDLGTIERPASKEDAVQAKAEDKAAAKAAKA